MTAHERLSRALAELLAADRWPRCCADPAAGFLSDDATEREHAAQLCRGCPLLEACGDVGESERFGVFGGIDRTVSKHAPGRPKVVAS